MRIFAIILLFVLSFKTTVAQLPTFHDNTDLLFLNLDCKTDVDDVHTAAAFADLIKNRVFKYHVVAGTYGIQEGLYVPPNELLKLNFKNNWSDAHHAPKKSLDKCTKIALKTLQYKGHIFIADAGQSDFSALLIKSILAKNPDVDTKSYIHIVQHSKWNENVTSPLSLNYVKEKTDYHKIPDGNAVGNGTPGFRSPDFKFHDKLSENWKLAIKISNKYNGKNGRYLNEAIAAGGVDFSDLSEVCEILGLGSIKDSEEFFYLMKL